MLNVMTELEGRVVETLAGGQTRSALEFVTDLGIPFDEVKDAISHLADEGILAVSYRDEDETFYTLVDDPPSGNGFGSADASGRG
jgi:DNA-binding transcriptional regulator PaaX